jgi:ABC-2 type transport system ATP-binding protein
LQTEEELRKITLRYLFISLSFSMITAKGLTKYYGERCAIDDVSFSITKGEVVGFLGPNGAGKSTTMKIITGYMPPTKGEVRIGNLSVEEDAFEIRKRIGYLPEHNPLYLDFTVEEFLLAVMDIRHIAKHKKHLPEQWIFVD